LLREAVVAKEEKLAKKKVKVKAGKQEVKKREREVAEGEDELKAKRVKVESKHDEEGVEGWDVECANCGNEFWTDDGDKWACDNCVSREEQVGKLFCKKGNTGRRRRSCLQEQRRQVLLQHSPLEEVELS
jgi:ribosomal protein S27AE